MLDLAATLADEFRQTAAEYDRQGSFPHEHFDRIRQTGYHTLTVPKEAGGHGAGVEAMVKAQARLAEGDAATALAMSWHLYVIGKQAQSQTWPARIRHRIFNEVVNEGALLNAAASEPATGSPSRGGLPTTKARRLADGSWVLNGHKNFTTLSPVLRYFIVSATIAGSQVAGWFLVPNDAPGLRIEETWDSLGMRATGSHDLWLDEVHLPADALLERATERGGALADGWNLHVPAIYLGIAQAARNFAVGYAAQRRTIGTDGAQRVGDRPHTKSLLGHLDLKLLPARTLLFDLARRWDQQLSTDLALPIAASKLVVVEAALEVVDKAMRIVGGESLAKRHPLERYYRDVRAGLHNPPMEDVVLNRLAEAALAEFSP